VSCSDPIPFERLVAYWAGELDGASEAALEEHAMECGACSTALGRVAEVTEGLRAIVPPVVTRASLERVRTPERRVREDTVTPGVVHEAPFPAELDLLVFRLALDLAAAERVAIELRAKETGEVVFAAPDVPFDTAEGAVLLVCQRHYAALPSLIDVAVMVRAAGGRERAEVFTIHHHFETRPSERER
jgi:hypothetical protein